MAAISTQWYVLCICIRASKGLFEERKFIIQTQVFTGKYTTRKIHTNHIFHILTSDDIDDFTDIKFVSYMNMKIVLKSIGLSSNYLRVFLESLAIFSNLWQRSCDLRTSFGKPLETGKWSEIFAKSSRTLSLLCYIIKQTLHVSSKI